MDALTTYHDQWRFHAAGTRGGSGFADIDVGSLRPALLAPYQDLGRLRHDFPLVLLDEPGDDGLGLPLSTVINRLALERAPRGVEGERLRRLLLRLEREIRSLVAQGKVGRLSELWALALPCLAVADDDPARRVLAQAAESLPADGELAPCDEHLPARVIEQAWRHAQLDKSRAFHRVTDALMRQLSDILRAAWAHSQAGQQPMALQAAVGAAHAEVFDFEQMSRLVARRTPQDELPAGRRKRIEWALDVLSRQAFWPGARSTEALPEGLRFDDCASAMRAFRERLPQAVELLQAIEIAELEAAGRYVEAEHDAVFAGFDVHSLGTEDFALLPDALVCIPPEHNDAPENAGLLDMLSSGMPVKVLVQVSDLLEEAAFGSGHFAFGVRSARLATTAMGLGGMFVLQAAAAALPSLKARVALGMVRRGPALFTVFAGSPAPAAGLPRYLTAAAAAKARAFPSFSYDAAAGATWATRFSLDGNRNADADWALESIEFADDELQRVVEPVAFTYADFALTDRRHAAHFAVLPRARWHAGLLPAAEWLRLPDNEAAGKVPYVLAVDAEGRLHRVIVDARLMKAARACLLLWHRLQEHAGIHDSHAERLLAKERARLVAAAVPPPAAEAASAATTALPHESAVPDDAPPTAPPSDEAWIETLRCPSCNECKQVNPRMFAYNDNKQAYIKDLGAGTYRELVEAAEACQVAIIHPGKPRNPNEPGLEELLERAKPFL
jgi:ferredoxin